MSPVTRRQFILTSAVASAGVAVLPVSCLYRNQGQQLKRNRGKMLIVRYQPEGIADRTGFETIQLDRLATLFGGMIEEGLHPGAQLAIYRQGECVIALAGGLDAPSGKPVTMETLFQIRSTTKALATIVMLMLHDRGHFSFDDPVAKHWPRFGSNHKESITIAHIMSHRAGIPDGPMIPVHKMDDRSAVAAAVEAMKPIWPPGNDNGYHAASFGWVLDELVYRWEGINIHQFLKTEIIEPLGIRDVYLGLPKEAFPRMAKMVVEERVRQRQQVRARFSDFLNTFDGIRLPLSWVSGVATARELAKLMQILAYEGTFDSTTFFSKETQRLASNPTNESGKIDRRLLWPVRWGLGFILGDTPHIYGTPPHPRAVGHAGGGAGVAWADPERRLSAAFLCNSMLGGTLWWERYQKIGDQIYAAIR